MGKMSFVNEQKIEIYLIFQGIEYYYSILKNINYEKFVLDENDNIPGLEIKK